MTFCEFGLGNYFCCQGKSKLSLTSIQFSLLKTVIKCCFFLKSILVFLALLMKLWLVTREALCYFQDGHLPVLGGLGVSLQTSDVFHVDLWRCLHSHGAQTPACKEGIPGNLIVSEHKNKFNNHKQVTN